MSKENVGVVRRAFDAFNAEDTASFVDFWDPECQFFSVTGSQMDARPYRGHAGLRQYREEVTETWNARILEGKDNDVVVAVGSLRGEGRGSGVLVEQRIGILYELCARKIRYCRAYLEPRDALEAAGLRE